MAAETDWRPPPPALLRIAADGVHVWRASLDLPPAALHRLHATLSEAERERAERSRSAAARDRFIAGRGIVRDVLSRYLGAEPASLRIAAGERGKPSLAGSGGWLRFNASNSAGVTLVAVTRERDVGVDVEELRPVPGALAIADRMLSPRERETLRGLPADARESAFLHCWTRKEAFIKALGAGLWTGLDGFDVAFAPGDEPRLLAVAGSEANAARWTLRALEPGPGFVGAVVVAGPAAGAELFTWSPPAGEAGA